jgi:hypothetical protein
LPQIGKYEKLWTIDDEIALAEIERGWKTPPRMRLKTIGDKGDRVVGHILSETDYPPDTKPEFVAQIPRELKGLASNERAVVLLYPVRPKGHIGKPILGFEVLVPKHPVKLGWVVIEPNQDLPVVETKAPPK